MTNTRNVTLELPPLDAREALRLVHILESLQRALWKAHGPEMSELLIDCHIAAGGDAESRLDLFGDDADLPF
jgi:hypothetical protein